MKRHLHRRHYTKAGYEHKNQLKLELGWAYELETVRNYVDRDVIPEACRGNGLSDRVLLGDPL